MRKDRYRKKKFPVYWAFLAGLVALLSVLCVIGVSVADDILEEYEITRPQNVLSRFLGSLSEQNLAPLVALSGFHADDLNSFDSCEKWLSAKYENRFSEITFLQSTLFSGKNNIRYNLFLDGERKGSILLSELDTVSKHGFTMWKVSSADILTYDYSYTLTVPADASVLINGKEIGEQYLVRTEPIPDYPEFNGVKPPENKVYSVGDFLLKPEISVKIPSSEAIVASDDGENIVYIRNNSIYKETAEFIAKAMAQYVMCVSLGDDLSKYLAYLIPDSDYYERMLIFHKGWILYQPEFNSTKVSNFRINNYREFSDTQIKADVSFEYTVISDYSEQVYPSDFVVYLLKTSDGWKIAEMENK